MALKNLIDRFNNNDLEFLTVFVGNKDEEEWDTIRRFLNLVEKKGLIELISPGERSFEYNYIQNMFDKYLFNNPETRNKFIEYVARGLWKNISYENGRIFLVLKDMEDLAQLFCFGDETRSGPSSYDLAYNILREDSFEPYYDTTQDVHEDVIKVLTKENFKKLCNIISQNFDTLNINNFSYKIHNTLIPNLASLDGDENTLRFSEKNVAEMLKDSNTFKFLKDEVFSDDFRISLKSCHSNAYNGALSDEYYKSVRKELESVGIGKGVWGSDENKKNIYRIDITENFVDLIHAFIESHIGYGTNLSDFTNYFSLVEETRDYSDEYECLRLRVSDYPDYRKVIEYINDSFFDYLEL
jgi:hypothetical protein